MKNSKMFTNDWQSGLSHSQLEGQHAVMRACGTKRRILPVSAVALFALTATSFAVDREWANIGTAFTTVGNWVGGTVPANSTTADIAVFGNAGASAVNPNLAANRSINGFSFPAGSKEYTFTGAGVFTLGAGGWATSIVHNGGNVQTFSNGGLILNGSQKWQFAAAGGELVINTVISGNNLSLYGAGAGTATLLKDNTITGLELGQNTKVNLNHPGAPGTGTITTSNQSVIDNTSGAAITLKNNNNVYLNNVTLIFKGTYDLSLGGGVIRSPIVNRDLRIDGGTLTAAGLSSSTPGALNGITIAGAGTLVIGGNASDMGGTVNVSDGTGGTLILNNTAGSGTGTGAVSVNNGGKLGGHGIIDTDTTDNGVTVAAGGKLAPTAAALSLRMDLGAGSLNIGGAVTAANSQSLLFTLGTESSKVTLTNADTTLNIGTGVLEFDDFVFTAGAGFGVGTYTLIETSNTIAGSLGSNLSGMIEGNAALIGLDNSGQHLILTFPPRTTVVTIR